MDEIEAGFLNLDDERDFISGEDICAGFSNLDSQDNQAVPGSVVAAFHVATDEPEPGGRVRSFTRLGDGA